MKRNAVAVFMVVAGALALMGAGGEGGREGGGHATGGHETSGGRSSGTVYRQRRVSVPRTAMPRAEHVVRDGNRAAFPQNDEKGARISKPAAGAPPAHHAEVVRNAGFARNTSRLERTETAPNHYYWHNDGGIRYSHYYDGHNHWYGFYHGPTFYWTRYYGNRWWWFDAAFSRWVFWGNGFWWWPGPGGVAYVYMDNNYYPYENAGVTVEQPVVQPTPASIPAPDQGSTTNSPDNRRMVQVFGADAQAFLYNKTATPPTFMKYLGSGVSKVRFSGGTGGAPLQILVEFKDETFALFNADGDSQSAAVPSTDSNSAPPPAAPDSIPPPPSSAPGQ